MSGVTAPWKIRLNCSRRRAKDCSRLMGMGSKAMSFDVILCVVVLFDEVKGRVTKCGCSLDCCSFAAA